MAKEVFLSHSSQDRGLAAAACAYLEAHGINCWIAPRDILPGQRWGESIVQALDECPLTVLLLTAQANQSRHVIREVERADGKMARIITFRVDDVVMNPSLEYFLSAEHWLDALSRPVEAHLPALTRAVQALRALGRQSVKAPERCGSPSRAPAMNDHDLADVFDELAPDDWDRAPRGRLSRFFQALFEDR